MNHRIWFCHLFMHLWSIFITGLHLGRIWAEKSYKANTPLHIHPLSWDSRLIGTKQLSVYFGMLIWCGNHSKGWWPPQRSPALNSTHVSELVYVSFFCIYNHAQTLRNYQVIQYTVYNRGPRFFSYLNKKCKNKELQKKCSYSEEETKSRIVR